MTELRLEGVGKDYEGRTVLSDLTVTVSPGELFAVLGPSGCGKSTALRIVAGFVAPDRGRVHCAGVDITDLAPERRDAAMVFQSYALFPHLDVGDNVAFGLSARGQGGGGAGDRVKRALELVGLSGYERRDVGVLSGGEQQRVALARAIVVEPRLLLLDEPMSNLDPKLRAGTRRDLRALQKRLGITTLYVTHDQEEALEIADRVAVLDRGRAAQVATPGELYDRPADAFVARFVGAANVLEGRVLAVSGGEAKLALVGREVVLPGAGFRAGETVELAVRPECLRLGAPRTGEVELGEGQVESVSFSGPSYSLSVALAAGLTIRALVLNDGERAVPPAGTAVRLAVPRDKLVRLKPPK